MLPPAALQELKRLMKAQEINRHSAALQTSALSQCAGGILHCRMPSDTSEQAVIPVVSQSQPLPIGSHCHAHHPEVQEVKAHRARLHLDSSGIEADAELVSLIKGYLQDPAFQEEVDRVAQLWDRAEAELLAEHEEHGATDMELESFFTST